jgi:hypothetical protein
MLQLLGKVKLPQLLQHLHLHPCCRDSSSGLSIYTLCIISQAILSFLCASSWIAMIRQIVRQIVRQTVRPLTERISRCESFGN